MNDSLGPEDKTVVNVELGDVERPALPYLVIADGPRAGNRYHLIEDDNLLGRAPGCHVLLEDQSVSRRHCAAAREGDTITLRDLGSKNGTILNNRPVEESVVVGHGDLIQLGIYVLRVITREVPVEEELAPVAFEEERPEEQPLDGEAETATSVAADLDDPFADDLLDGESSAQELVPVEDAEQPKSRRGLYLGLVAATLVVLGASSWIYTTWFIEPEQPVEKLVERTIPEETTVDETVPPAELVPEVPPAPAEIPVFLDFASSPMPAQVVFGDKNFGLSPVKVNSTLTVGESYTAEGHFEMPEFKETHVERVNFTVAAESSVLPVFFRAPIGIFKVEKLPRDVQLSIEGYFSYDQFTPRHATLANVSYGKPMYMPYGRYIVELRRLKEIGASGQFVPDIRYRREVFLTQDSPTFALTVANEELDSFPVDIRSTPSGAQVFVDSKPAGKTPYQGVFPLGEHSLVLRKDGYLEYSQLLQNDINVVYSLDVALKTTLAGEYINDGRKLVQRGHYDQAIAKLAEAFNKDPGAAETAQANYYLGVAYLGKGEIDRAYAYFEQAESHPDFALQAKLGKARVKHQEGKRLEALPFLVEVMLRAQPGPVKDEAAQIFKEISPLKSVLYVHTAPEGATVFVNDEVMDTTTPLILHDLGLGNYKLRIERDGYQPKEINVNLTVHEFNPVIVRLQELEE